MLRREVLSLLAGTAAAAAQPGWAAGLMAPPVIDSRPFSLEALLQHARTQSAKDFTPRAEVPKAWQNLTYDQYKSIWFRHDRALWNHSDTPYRVDFFHPGLYFPHAVQINIVQDGAAHRLGFDFSLFDKTDQVPDLPIDPTMGFSGLRLRAELEKDGIFQEFMVMQGASYFRAIATGETYGLSARGLAIKTADPMGEEFPDFTEFWIERPEPGAKRITIHAFMDSPSTTGVYSFDVAQGAPTVIDVRAHLFPRRPLDNIGLAPLTSMFLFDETNRARFDDFRPAVHDSDGLLVHNGAGEALWRPLANPTQLQVSSFVDQTPKGFGLMQRPRAFSDFADLEAHYHQRPGLWIEPGEDWGNGAVTLVEIPADREIYDNIVAYWRPREPLESQKETTFSYRMTWGQDPSSTQGVAKVLNTRVGKRFGGGYIVAIDFEHHVAANDLENLIKHISSNRGTVSDGVLQRNPETGGPRLAFSFDPEGAASVELRAQLRDETRNISEVWLYRWTQT